ncbi:uncharacterized protein TNCV_2340691 [Trichonephila clavipes]|nr:uncharacterized protein TNCV_2340691 [Trichonephila clavipes]
MAVVSAPPQQCFCFNPFVGLGKITSHLHDLTKSACGKRKTHYNTSKNIPVAPQPPYSPDLSPCDFFLFPKLKNPLKGHHFGTLENIQTAVSDQLKAIPISEFHQCHEEERNVSSAVWLQKAVTLKEIMLNLVKVSDHGRRVTSSSLVPLKTHRLGEKCTLNLSNLKHPPGGVVVRRRGDSSGVCPRHLTMVQNDEVRRQKPSCS